MSPLLKSTELTGTDQTCFTHPGLDRRTGQLAIYTRPVTPLCGVTHLPALCVASRGAKRQGARLHRGMVRSAGPGKCATRLPGSCFSYRDCNFGRDDDRSLLPGKMNSSIGENTIAT